MTNFEGRTPLRDASNGGERSPLLLEMDSVHLRLSQALKEVDGFMSSARDLFCANHLSSDEARNFTTAMTEMADCVEAWRRFLKTAAERSCALMKEDGLIDLEAEAESLSCSGGVGGDASADENMFVIDSPPCKSRSSPLFALTPLQAHHPSKSRPAARTARSSRASPKSFDASQSLDVSTFAAARAPPAEPSPLSCGTQESMELITPQSLRKRGAPRGGDRPWPQRLPSTPVPALRPNSADSPQSVCKPANPNGSPADGDLATPNCVRSGVPSSSGAPIGTPYSTPVSELRRPLTPFSATRLSVPLQDDEMTNSTIQRMGVKGLEEELWRQMKAWHIDTNLRAPYAKLRASSGIPMPNHGASRRKGDV